MTSPQDVRHALIARHEIALLDVREEAAYANAHPLFAANLPLSRLEVEVLDRLPRRTVPVVLYDDGEGFAARALSRLRTLGYSNSSLLEGGLAGWRAAGYEVFRDVNSYSKAFGELVEARRHTPSLPAPELKARLDRGDDLVILDARRFEEYATMNIPGGTSVPGAELALRAPLLAPDLATTIIVNCAGRTRSLIGAQSLINAGLPNPIYALRNGTIGWTLEGLDLDKGSTAAAPEIDLPALETARTRARAVAYRAGVRHITPADLDRFIADRGRTLYRFDVRTPAEHAAGHPRGFRNYPGGQLVQETDMAAPVRGARIVLHDDLGPRADMTASWLAQMGWDVLVVTGLPNTIKGTEPVTLPPFPDAETITPADIPAALAAGARLIDLAPSPAYRRGHIAGAVFAIRARLAADLAVDSSAADIILTSPGGALARFTAAELTTPTRRVRALNGGTNAHIAAGGTLEPGNGETLSPFDDVYRRPYEGTDNPRAAMQAYLDWEYGLVDQLKQDATHGFVVI
ncbi:thiosulfate sulfurtransferase [Polymorphobacter glacialis]|uniref:Thiosulfate sulfurtransferase n=1 Tax=Sandarakinorhabdus glacialis TaxID=1614636 RepID=A0A917E826_9SPHN|nr:thiosulfate sulfurtransferase [Polymorphobacter glacialis]